MCVPQCRRALTLYEGFVALNAFERIKTLNKHLTHVPRELQYIIFARKKKKKKKKKKLISCCLSWLTDLKSWFRGQDWSKSYRSTSRSYDSSVSITCGTQCIASSVQRATRLQGGRFYSVRVSPTMETDLPVRGVFSGDVRPDANHDKKPTFELRDQTINSKNKGKAKKRKKKKT